MAVDIEQSNKKDEWTYRAICSCGYKGIATSRFEAYKIARIHSHPMNLYLTDTANTHGTSKQDWDLKNPSVVLQKLLDYAEMNGIPICKLNRK